MEDQRGARCRLPLPADRAIDPARGCGLPVNACDPDREGEAIFRRIADMEGSRKPELRLWVASLEAEAIQAAWRAMKPESEYQGLAWSAEIRSKADWLIGMNASRAYSLLYNARFSVGRVQTPTLAMIAERDRQIRNHKPVPFWTVIADMGGWRLSSERIDSKDAAMLLCGQAERGRFRIMSVNRRRVNDRPPRLYDLTGLQKDMSRMYGMTAARTLQALQHLYELKLATYPRTDSRYITHDDLETLTALLESGRLAQGFVTREGIPGHPRPELAVNDAKVAGHTAILPTMQLDAGKLEGLDDDERKVMTRIVRRMWEAVGDDHVHIVTEVKARLSDDTDREFSSRSDETVSAGWKAVETGHGPEPEDEETANPAGGRNVIPSNLMEGGVIRPVGKVTVEEGETRPPKPFTEATLLAAMEHASRCVEDKNLKAHSDGRRITFRRHRHTRHPRGHHRKARALQTRGTQGPAIARHHGRRTPHRRGGATTEGRAAHRTDGTGVVRRGTRQTGPGRRDGHVPPGGIANPRRRDREPQGRCRHTNREHRRAGMGRLPALRPAGEENRPDVAVFHEQDREDQGRQVGHDRRLRMEDVRAHRGQDHHRPDRAQAPRGTIRHPEGLHIQIREEVRRGHPHRQGTRHGVRFRPLTKRQPSVPDAPCRAGHGNDQGDDETMRRYSHAFRVLMDQELFNLLAEASTKTGIPKSRFVRYAIQPFSYTELAPGTTDWNDVYRTDPDPEHPLKRGRQLNVMLTGDEYTMLCRAAFKLGIARSAWVRERVYALLCRSYADELSPLTDASIRDNATMLLKELKAKGAGR